jgi:hypothetical protein
MAAMRMVRRLPSKMVDEVRDVDKPLAKTAARFKESMKNIVPRTCLLRRGLSSRSSVRAASGTRA